METESRAVVNATPAALCAIDDGMTIVICFRLL